MLVTSPLRIRLRSSFGRRQDCIEQLALGLGDESRTQLAAKRAPHFRIGSVSAIRKLTRGARQIVLDMSQVLHHPVVELQMRDGAANLLLQPGYGPIEL